MKFLTSVLMAAVVSFAGISPGHAAECEQINHFEGLIFDAGAFPADVAMPSALDEALFLGVEKVTLFPHPAAKGENRPGLLEKSFPDLVIRGFKPWSKAAPVIWPEPLQAGDLGRLADEMARHPERSYLLSSLSRFDPQALERLAGRSPNLWFGVGPADLKALLKSCAQGPLQDIINQVEGRVVFTSFGGARNWKYYKYIIADLRAYAALIEARQADAILFRNAQTLYDIAVNAP